uniref:Uncharacterized protein n=1 Tax=Oncorhynchus tshawytscha TaxID=74940 RepID=A0A8C8MC59_ONCTS
ASPEYSNTELAGVPCRFELACFHPWSVAFGALNGLRMGLSETKNMAWSKPLNVHRFIESVTWANTLGSVGECLSFPTRAEDDIITVVAGTMTGMLYKSTGQKVKHSIIKVIIGTQGVTITWLYILYIQNNMDTPSN